MTSRRVAALAFVAVAACSTPTTGRTAVRLAAPTVPSPALSSGEGRTLPGSGLGRRGRLPLPWTYVPPTTTTTTVRVPPPTYPPAAGGHDYSDAVFLAIGRCEQALNWTHRGSYNGGLGIANANWSLAARTLGLPDPAYLATPAEQIVGARWLAHRYSLSGWACWSAHHREWGFR